MPRFTASAASRKRSPTTLHRRRVSVEPSGRRVCRRRVHVGLTPRRSPWDRIGYAKALGASATLYRVEVKADMRNWFEFKLDSE